MRLIDADALIEHLKEYKTIYGVPMTDSDKQVIHYIVGHIKNIEPTAYDVESVVAKLKENSLTKFDWSEAIDLDEAISIVLGKE